jgi:hypothetical protein
MKSGPDLEKEARGRREQARRARRMADSLSQDSDRTRILRYADGLDAQAAELEQQGGNGMPPIVDAPATPTQQQVQREQAKVPPPDSSPPKPRP